MQIVKVAIAAVLFVLLGAVTIYFVVSDEDYGSAQSDTVELGMSAFEDGRYKEAFHWFEKAARQGDSKAQYHLAKMYQQGKGTDRDDTQAVRWFRMAAKQLHAEAQYQLAIHMEHKRGIQQVEPRKMAAWYLLAANKGVAASMFRVANLYAEGRGVDQSDEKALAWVIKAENKGVIEAEPIDSNWYHV